MGLVSIKKLPNYLVLLWAELSVPRFIKHLFSFVLQIRVCAFNCATTHTAATQVPSTQHSVLSLHSDDSIDAKRQHTYKGSLFLPKQYIHFEGVLYMQDAMLDV